MKNMVLVALASLLVVAVLPVQAATSAYTSSLGTAYVVSTGTKSGSCDTVPGGGMECIDGSNQISATDSGCSEKLGLASCIIGEPVLIPAGTSTLECETQNYEVTDGGTGECDENDGVSMGCTQPGTSNYASADCATGCGPVNGSGKCTPKSKPS